MQKSIFITGAARGIGQATAELFARKGYLVGAYDVAPVEWAEGNPNVITGTLDVTDRDQWDEALAEFTSHTGGQLNILFNNAGLLIDGPFLDADEKREEALIDVNVKGITYSAHAAFPYLQRTPKSQFVSMGSAAGIVGTPDMALYSASKFAVRGLTEALGIEWKKYDIRVLDMMPLYVKTPMLENVETQGTRRMGVRIGPEDVAHEMWKATHGISRYFPMQHFPVGLQTRILYLGSQFTPNFIVRFVNRLLVYGFK
ncbi:MAG: SDR family oxidoreductase [Lawsonella sp.]